MNFIFLNIHMICSLYAIIIVVLVDCMERDDLLYNLMHKIKAAWFSGNVFGKAIILISTIIGMILMLPALCIYFLILLSKKIVRGFIRLGFPTKRPFRKEIPIPFEADLQRLRERDINFIIGADYIAFDCVVDYKKALKILKGRKDINEE